MEFSFKDILNIIKKNIIFMLIVAILAAVGTYFATALLVSPTYTSTVAVCQRKNQRQNKLRGVKLAQLRTENSCNLHWSIKHESFLFKGRRGTPRQVQRNIPEKQYLIFRGCRYRGFQRFGFLQRPDWRKNNCRRSRKGCAADNQGTVWEQRKS